LLSGVEWIATTAPGSAIEQARAAVARGARNVIAAGGDGTLHEVARGLLSSGVAGLELGLLPVGSANDYAFSVAAELDQLPQGSPPVLTVDVGRVVAGPFASPPVVRTPGTTLSGFGGAEPADRSPQSSNRTAAVVAGAVPARVDGPIRPREPTDQPDFAPADDLPLGSGRVGYFLSGLGLGLNGLVTEEAHQVRWLQGLWLYGWATLKALRRQRELPHLSIQVGQAIPWVGPTLLFSLLLGQREGNFRLAPEARLGDGWFNFIRSDLESLPEILALLPRVAWWGAPRNHPRVQLGLCQSARVLSQRPLTVHIDGELFCREADGITEIDCQLLPARLRVRLWNRE
ncbi:MAG: diacylglycerol/lipid kinase family protein, partial [Planctomycetaceae bacterium]